MSWNLAHRSLCLVAAVASAPAALRAQTSADSTALARLVAAITAAKVPAQASDSVVLALPRTRWDSAVVRELRSLRHWLPPADTVLALRIEPTTLWLQGDRAIVTVSWSRCQLELRSTLNWWRTVRQFEFRRVGAPEEARWEAILGPGRVTSSDGHCTRSAVPGARN
jgi:hypothetical protein